MFLVEEGASPLEVDSVMENLGLLMGPFKVNDLSGKLFLVKYNLFVSSVVGEFLFCMG
jgi:3-hydroxyacyl-CoA dehydrogenase